VGQQWAYLALVLAAEKTKITVESLIQEVEEVRVRAMEKLSVQRGGGRDQRDGRFVWPADQAQRGRRARLV